MGVSRADIKFHLTTNHNNLSTLTRMVFPPSQHLTSGLSQASTAGSDVSSISPPSTTCSPRSSRQEALTPATTSHHHQPTPSYPASSYYSASARGTDDRPSFDGSYTDTAFGTGSDEYSASSSGTRSPPPEQADGFANYQTYSSNPTPMPGSSHFGTGRFDYVETFSSRASSPVPRLGSGGWDSLSPHPDQLLNRLSGSRNRSRNPSGASTPVADKEAQYGSDCE